MKKASDHVHGTFIFLGGSSSPSLGYVLDGMIDIQVVTCYVRVDARHFAGEDYEEDDINS